MSEKSQVTRTSKNVFEKSNSKTQYFVREVKGRRMTKNGVELFIGWRDFPLDKDDTWEPITNLPGSEHMIAEFQRHWEEQYKIKTSEQLQSVIDKRNTRNEKNAQTQRERDTAADMDEARADGDDDDEGGNSEDDHGEYDSTCMDVDVDSVEAELNAYTRVQQVPLDTDPLMWWKQHVQEFPRLARMARQHLAVPATSASPERLFSSVGLVKSDLRGRLLDSTLIDVMWAKQVP